MINFKFTQTDLLKSIFIFVIASNILANLFQMAFSKEIAMLLGNGLGTILLFWLIKKYFFSSVEFHETYLRLNKDRFRKEVEINYSEINKITFSYKRGLNLFTNTTNTSIRLPSPVRLNKAEELFAWLKTKNPNLEVEITKKNNWQ